MIVDDFANSEAAQSHFILGFRCETEARGDDALNHYQAAARICHTLRAWAMESLVLAYQARVLRNRGEIKQAIGYIEKADNLLSMGQIMQGSQAEKDRTNLYVRSEVETVWGTLYLKMPLPQDQQKASEHFTKAISVLEELQINIEQDEPFRRSFCFLVNLDNSIALQREVAHNIAINRINLAEICLIRETDKSEADRMADAIMETANKLKDWKLQGAATRIKGEIAYHTTDFNTAIFWFEKSLFAYKQHGRVNPEVITAVTTRLLHARTMQGMITYENSGSPKRLKWFDKIPRLIVFLYKPFLLNLDSRAYKMPADQAQELYLDAAMHWAGADWHDRTFKYLVKAIECIDTIRANQLVGGEFHAHRRTEYFAKRVLLPFHYLIMLLLSSKYGKRTGVPDPIAEAFYYREKCGAIGLLDELETAKHLITNYTERIGQQEQLNQIRQYDINSGYATRSGNRNNVRALEDKRAEKINELCDPELRELLTGQVARVEDVQKFLPPRTVLIEYVLTDSLFTAFVITSDSVKVPIFECSDLPHHKPQIHPDELNQKVKNYLNAISHDVNSDGKPIGLPVERDLDIVKRQGKWLYDTLLRPTEFAWRSSDLSSVERLIIVPHGSLHHLPFSTLFDGTRFVAEVIPTIQSPSASALRYFYNNRPSTPIQFSYFGLSNPKGDLHGCDEVVLAAARQLGFKGDWMNSRLENASKSILAVQHEAATKSVWLANAPNYTCIDLETHGSSTESGSLSHGFLLADDGDGRQDCWFTAKDVFLYLRMHTELLVAAMCYSGQSKVFVGDELGGLIRAFIYAGCRSILLYPWALEDTVVPAFVTKFFQHLVATNSQGIPQIVAHKDQALQMAQIHIITQGRQGKYCKIFYDKDWEYVNVSWEHPYYWSWTLVGDHI